MNEAKDKAKKASDLHAQIQARLASMAGLPAPMKGMPPVKASDKPGESQLYVLI